MFAFFAFLVALSLWLAGCANDKWMKEGVKVNKSTIEWVDKTPESCGSTIPSSTLLLHGCAAARYTSDGTNCTLTMRRDSPDWLVAHEMKHCFGFIHTY